MEGMNEVGWVQEKVGADVLMYLKWPQTDPWEALREAILPALVPALQDLGLDTVLTLSEGTRGGPMLALSPGGLILSPELLGPDQYAPPDRRWLTDFPQPLAPLALDRERRAVGIILEGLLLRRLAEQQGHAPESLPLSWWSVGAAADRVDHLVPQLGWLWQSAVGLLQQPWNSMDNHPRRGAWFFRWRRLQGRPLDIAPPPRIEPGEWVEFGQWCRDTVNGPAHDAPLPVVPARPRNAPTTLPPLSHHPTRFTAGPAGLRVSGAALSPPVRLGGNEAIVSVLGTVVGGAVQLNARPTRLLGRWCLISGQAGQRAGVAEGITLHFHRRGLLEISLGNAWVGPLGEAPALAKQIGASGRGSGRWQVQSLSETEGEGVLVLSNLDIDQINIHPRHSKMRRFALRAQKNHLERARRLLTDLSGKTLRFGMESGHLVVQGRVRDWNLLIRMKPLG